LPQTQIENRYAVNQKEKVQEGGELGNVWRKFLEGRYGFPSHFPSSFSSLIDRVAVSGAAHASLP
jgi:hypothetical protein